MFSWFGTLTSLYMLYVFSWALTAIAETTYFIHCYRHAAFDHPQQQIEKGSAAV